MNCWAILPYKHFEIKGNDANNFLQGQITADINLITKDKATLAAHCNHKGRMISSFLVYENNIEKSTEDATKILRINTQIADKALLKLKMFVLRSKVSFDEINTKTIGLTKKLAEIITEKNNIKLPNNEFEMVNSGLLSIIRMPNNLFQCYVLEEDLTKITELLDDNLENLNQFNSLQISGGYFDVLLETTETILPQNTMLELWNAISYNKGCFVGQEIIARSKYLGKSKKAIAFAKIKADINRFAEINLDNKQVSKIISKVQYDGYSYVLAIITNDLVGKTVIIENNETKFQQLLKVGEK